MRRKAPALLLGLALGSAPISTALASVLGTLRDTPLVVPPEAPRRRDAATPLQQPTDARIFINFEGAELEGGWDDAALDRTQIPELVGTFAAFGDDASRRASIMQALAEDYAEYRVEITDERPSERGYTMAMVGPTNPFGPATLGMAPLDCADAQTSANIAFAFYSADDGRSPIMAATTIGHEVAHTFGLEHIDEATAVMNPYNVGGDPWFHEECIPVVGEVFCAEQHAQICGVADEQSSHHELLALFGPAQPDSTPPDVAIVAPFDEDAWPAGIDLEIEVEAADAQGIAEVRLWEGDRLLGVDVGRPFGWRVTAPEAGEYSFVVEAVDRAGNRARSREVALTVDHVDDDPQRVLGPGGPHPAATPHDGDSPGDGVPWAQDEAAVELACSAAPGRPAPWWVLLGAMLAAVRQQRR